MGLIYATSRIIEAIEAKATHATHIIMTNLDGTFWSTDKALFAALPGGQAVINWFGFVPAFHDAKLIRLELTGGTVSMTLHAHRMTDVADTKGRHVLDKHAIVTFHLSDVTGVRLTGDASSILMELGVRRVGDAPTDFSTCGGPHTGDIEVSFEASYGLEGSIYARDVKLTVKPLR